MELSDWLSIFGIGGPIGGAIGIMAPRAFHVLKTVLSLEERVETVEGVAAAVHEDVNADRSGLKDRVLVLETKAKSGHGE